MILHAALTTGGQEKAKAMETTTGKDPEVKVMLWGLEEQKRLVSPFP